MSKYKVDVIIPTYNSETTVVRAINSALAQDIDGLRLLVVDDCSTDNTRALLSELAASDTRVQPIFLSSNVGAGIARRKAIESRDSEFIAFLDSDDVWMPEKINRSLAVFAKDLDVFIVHSARWIYNATNGAITRDGDKHGVTPPSTFSVRNPITTSSAVVRASARGIEKMPSLRARQDYIYWRFLVQSNPALRVHRIGDPLVIYQTGVHSLSSSPLRNLRNNFLAFYRGEGLRLEHSAGLVVLNVASKIWHLSAQKRLSLSTSEEQAVRALLASMNTPFFSIR